MGVIGLIEGILYLTENPRRIPRDGCGWGEGLVLKFCEERFWGGLMANWLPLQLAGPFWAFRAAGSRSPGSLTPANG